MDEKTKVLICLSAATAANCIPCFEHYFGKTGPLDISKEDIQIAVDLASQVKKGAHMTLKNRIDQLRGGEKKYDLPCDKNQTSCCG